VEVLEESDHSAVEIVPAVQRAGARVHEIRHFALGARQHENPVLERYFGGFELRVLLLHRVYRRVKPIGCSG
jgi:hypothetical protein